MYENVPLPDDDDGLVTSKPEMDNCRLFSSTADRVNSHRLDKKASRASFRSKMPQACVHSW